MQTCTAEIVFQIQNIHMKTSGYFTKNFHFMGERRKELLIKIWCNEGPQFKVFTTFSRATSLCMAAGISNYGRSHDLPCLNEISSAVLSCFTHSRQTSWMPVLLSWTGRLAQGTVQVIQGHGSRIVWIIKPQSKMFTTVRPQIFRPRGLACVMKIPIQIPSLRFRPSGWRWNTSFTSWCANYRTICRSVHALNISARPNLAVSHDLPHSE